MDCSLDYLGFKRKFYSIFNLLVCSGQRIKDCELISHILFNMSVCSDTYEDSLRCLLHQTLCLIVQIGWKHQTWRVIALMVVSVAFWCLKSVILRSLMIRGSVLMFFRACSETGNNFACFLFISLFCYPSHNFQKAPLLVQADRFPNGVWTP